MKAMTTIQGNLGAMQKKLEEAQQASDKLLKKGGKASSVKVDSANLKLDTASQEWDSQTPYVFEKLQAVDETRLNHLRDVLTQFQTHEADQVERNRITAENTLNSLLEI
jgi:enolase